MKLPKHESEYLSEGMALKITNQSGESVEAQYIGGKIVSGETTYESLTDMALSIPHASFHTAWKRVGEEWEKLMLILTSIPPAPANQGWS